MPRKNKNKPSKPEKRDIEKTLADLDIDTDLPPEAAALDLDAANQRALAEESRVETPLPASPAFAPKPISTVSVEPVRRATVEAVQQEEQVEEEFPDPDLLPFAAPPPVAAPMRKGARSPSTGKLGTGLSSKLPGAERIKVYKRVEGKLGHIQDFMMRDLTGFPDMESFLNRHVKPSYGAGEYELVGVDAYGKEVQAGSILLLSPPRETENTQASGAFGLVQTMMEQSQRQQREWMDQMRTSMQQPTQKDPIDTLRGMMELQEKVSEKGEAATASAAASTASAAQGTMQMFMAMMQQQTQQANQQAAQQREAADRQNQMMMALLSKPKEEDPVMKMLMMKMLEDKSSGGGNAIPPPPPPPASDPLDGIAKLIAALAAAGLMGGGGGGGDDEAKDLLKAMVAKADNERMGPKDMLALFSEMRGDRGTDDFKKSADNMAMMLNLTNQMRSSTEGGAAAGFFDALAALFSNRDFAGSIAQSVRSRAEGQQRSQMEVQQQQLMAQQRALMIAEREKQQRLAQDAKSRMPKAESAPVNGAVKPTNGAVKRAPVQVEEEVSMPPLPPNIADHVTNIVDAAEDDAKLIESTLRMLVYMSGYKEWRPYTEQLLAAAQNEDAREMLQYLASLLEVFVRSNLMSVSLARRVLGVVKDNFDLINTELTGDKGTEGVLDESQDGEIDFLEELDRAEAELDDEGFEDDDDDEDEDEDDEGIEDETAEESPRA